MSDKILNKLNFLMGLLPIAALFGVVVYVANIEIKDLDLWFHIGVGRYIVETGTIPLNDFVSHTITGKPWNNHEWLFQILVHHIFTNFGPDGLIKMQVVVVLCTMFLMLLLGYNKEKQLTTAISLWMVFMVYQQRFTIRPDLFSLLFFTIYIFILALHIDKKWSLPILFFVQILWSNMHGFFFFGPLFAMIGLVSEWIKRHVKLPYEWNESANLTDDEFKRLKVIFVFVVLACFVNPQGIEGALYPIGVFFSLGGENKIFFNHIQELQVPIKTFGDLFTGGPFVFYKLLVFISFITFIFNRRRIDISALFFWLVFLIFSLKAIRNLPFFAFAAYLVIITNMLNIDYGKLVPFQFSKKKFATLNLIIFKGMFLYWIFNIYCPTILGRSYYDFGTYERKSEFGGISRHSYPHDAVDFLVDNNVKGNFLNGFNSGAYLIGRTHPNIKVFIDGRTEVYGGKFFKNYLDLYQGDEELFHQAIDLYDITGIFINLKKPQHGRDMLKRIYSLKEWVLVYFDYDGIIFLKDVEKNKGLISKFAIDLNQWETKEVDLLKLGPEYVRPIQNYYRAFALEQMDFNEAALGEAQFALKVRPNYANAHRLLGKLHGKMGNDQKAFEHFRISTMFEPSNRESWSNLALSYYKLGEIDMAIQKYETIIRSWPSDPPAYFQLAKMYAINNDHDNLMTAIDNALKMDGKADNALIEIGDIAFENKNFTAAKSLYEKALKISPDLKEVADKIANIKTSQ